MACLVSGTTNKVELSTSNSAKSPPSHRNGRRMIDSIIAAPPSSGAALRTAADRSARRAPRRSEEHTSELQSLMRISYAVFCLIKQKEDTLNIQLNITYS